MLKPLGIIFASLLFALTLHAQTGNLLKDVLDKLSSGEALGNGLNELPQWLPTAPRELLAATLPQASGILANGTPGQRAVAVLLLYAVGRTRQDGTQLLKP